MDILEIKNVTYNYSNSREKILLSVNQKFELGQFYAIIGKSGAGKSTLLSLLAGLDKPQKGQILFKNEDIENKGYSNHRKNNITLVFQNYNLIDYLTPIENVRLVNKKASEDILLQLGLDKPKTGKILFKNEDIQKKGYNNHRKNNISLVFQNYNLIDYLSPIENIRLVNKSADESILFELGLDKKQIKRNVMKLSGGQQQRVAIARALVSDAPIILADEPTGNLDSVTAREIINILKTLAKDRDKCVIVVTHSKEVADSADIILELSGKKLKKVNKMNLEVE